MLRARQTMRLLDRGVLAKSTSHITVQRPNRFVRSGTVPHRLVHTYSDESPSTAFAVDQAPKDGVSQLSEGPGYHGVAADKLKGKEGVVI
jgi:hypothetical protein